jgi:hypothetical protein
VKDSNIKHYVINSNEQADLSLPALTRQPSGEDPEGFSGDAQTPFWGRII